MAGITLVTSCPRNMSYSNLSIIVFVSACGCELRCKVDTHPRLFTSCSVDICSWSAGCSEIQLTACSSKRSPFVNIGGSSSFNKRDSRMNISPCAIAHCDGRPALDMSDDGFQLLVRTRMTVFPGKSPLYTLFKLPCPLNIRTKVYAGFKVRAKCNKHSIRNVGYLSS